MSIARASLANDIGFEDVSLIVTVHYSSEKDLGCRSPDRNLPYKISKGLGLRRQTQALNTASDMAPGFV
jgi:hypothetical protein